MPAELAVEVCAVCHGSIEEPDPPGVGVMHFHQTCLPACRFCSRRYQPDEAGWDFRGQTLWSDEHGYLTSLDQPACAGCTDLGERRDYGPGS